MKVGGVIQYEPEVSYFKYHFLLKYITPSYTFFCLLDKFLRYETVSLTSLLRKILELQHLIMKIFNC